MRSQEMKHSKIGRKKCFMVDSKIDSVLEDGFFRRNGDFSVRPSCVMSLNIMAPKHTLGKGKTERHPWTAPSRLASRAYNDK